MCRVIAIAALTPLLAVGCVGVRPTIGSVVHSAADVSPMYVIGCPDVLSVRVSGRPNLDCLVAVDLDGRLPISPIVQPRVEGGTLDEARRAIAEAIGCEPGSVQVQLAEARSGRLYLFGPEGNRQHVMSYVGAERLVDFLHRSGGVWSGGSNLQDVFVVRPNITNGGEPLVFRADLAAVQQGDHSTNVILQPGDQVYVGESQKSTLARLLPDWLLPEFSRVARLGGWNAFRR